MHTCKYGKYSEEVVRLYPYTWCWYQIRKRTTEVLSNLQNRSKAWPEPGQETNISLVNVVILGIFVVGTLAGTI